MEFAGAPLEIRATREADWAEVRSIRIEMLRDSPTAFNERVEDALALNEESWRARVRRSNGETNVTVAAIADDGTWAGTMSAYVPADGTVPVLAAVYVRPRFRGGTRGVADQILDVIESWAASRGDTLALLVHEDNRRARRFYERRGFEETGRSEPYNLNPTQRELEMARRL
ncbi:GNAT family N-acetyltransferase [Microbacterium aurantiacum]|uniref:GNAT family N-acetyltransferase n=1 Tax=Microbacterium aurantiacum TaxID=162393 RepID=UPI003D75AC4A